MPRATITGAITVAAAAYAVLFASAYDQRVLTLAGVFALMVLGYHLVFGHAGALNLAQGAFFGLGAYTTGILGSQFGLTFAATFPLSIAAPALLAAAAGRVVLRLQTHYFALATLAIAQLLFVIAVNWQSVTGGANGIVGVPGVSILGVAVTAGTPLLVLTWVAVAVAAAGLHRYLAGPRRPAFALAAAAPLAASATGIDTATERYAAFIIAAAYAGAAGALYAHTLRVLSPDVLGFTIMISCLAMTVIGGRKSIVGAIAGALLLTILPELLRPLQAYYLAATGGATLLVVIFAPLGLAGIITRRVPPPPASAPEDAPPPDRPAAITSHDAPLAAAGLTKAFGGVTALTGVDLALAAGQVVGLIGPNGSGKTTLVNVVTGITRPDSGTVAAAGRPITAAPSHRIAAAGITRSFQTPEAATDLTPRRRRRPRLRPRRPPAVARRPRRRRPQPRRRRPRRRRNHRHRRPAPRHPPTGRRRARPRRHAKRCLSRRTRRRPRRCRATSHARSHRRRRQRRHRRRRHRAQPRFPRRSRRPHRLPRPGPRHRRRPRPPDHRSSRRPPRLPRHRAGGAGTMTDLLTAAGLESGYAGATNIRLPRLAVATGTAAALIGANGAGKTATLRAIIGLNPIRAGTLSFAGTDLRPLPPERRARLGIAYVPQGRRVFPGLTVAENLLVACHAPAPERASRLAQTLAAFPALADHQDRLAWRLSGGQQQMLAIGRALMGGPRLLLCDEPTLGLAPRVVNELYAALADVVAAGTAVLIAEQNAQRLPAFALPPMVLANGTIAR